MSMIKGIEKGNLRRKKINKKAEMQKMLQAALDAPNPKRKEAFLRDIEQQIINTQAITAQSIYTQGINNKEFILIQATYIRKTTWCVSFVLFLAAFMGAVLLDRNMLWLLAALVPFLAVCAVTENMRSENCGMAELEMASRFSLKSVMFARMEILGVIHFFLMGIFVFLGYQESLYSLLETGIYLMVPYLLTTFGGLWVSRQIHGKEASYVCLGVAAVISVLQLTMVYMQEKIYRADSFQWWILLFILLIVATVREMKIMLRRVEEIA